jgi:hypothetical protein
MARIDAVRSDLNKENQGVWVPYQMGIELKVARLGNPAYQQALVTLTEARKALLGCMELSDDQRADVQKEAVARTVLLDWRGIEDDEGNPIPYSPDQALLWFRDPELWRLYTFILMVGLEEERFRKSVLEAAAKN